MLEIGLGLLACATLAGLCELNEWRHRRKIRRLQERIGYSPLTRQVRHVRDLNDEYGLPRRSDLLPWYRPR